MWNPFKSKTLLSETDESFLIETYRWLLKYFGGDDFYQQAKLVLPTKEYFPTEVDSAEKAVEETFNQVKRYAGMETWPCTLLKQEEDPELYMGGAMYLQNVKQNPHGTFSVNENQEVIISYNPALVHKPVQMVATLAHELAHYLTSTAPEPPPGGWDNWEFATDIAATFLGFGIFQANSVFNFRQFSSAGTMGWSTSGGGYLSEAEHSYALAIFLLLKGISPKLAIPHCDGNIKVYLKKSLKDLSEKNHIEELGKVEFVTPEPLNKNENDPS